MFIKWAFALFFSMASAGINNPGTGGGVENGSNIINPGAGATFFVNSSTGNDSNPGTQASPWLTLHKVNNSVFASSTVVKLQGTFSGGDNGLIFTSTNVPSGGVSVTSYGAGATIQSGNSNECILLNDSLSAMSFSNITCTGGGNLVNTTAGIRVLNPHAASMPSGLTISGMTISGYGGDGILVDGTTTGSGFTNISILNNIVHDATGNFTTSKGTACINFTPNGTSSGVTITGNLVYNCTGTAGQVIWTGSGIVVGNSTTVTISYNVAHDSGSAGTKCGGPEGIWVYLTTGAIIKFNEVYAISYGSGGCDGDGLGFDIGTINSVLEYNYSHDNLGSGINVFNFSPYTLDNNIIRYNITEHNGTGASQPACEIQLGVAGANITNLSIYGNTLITSTANGGICDFGSGGTWSGLVENNIILSVGSQDNVIVGIPGTVTLDYNDYNGGTNFSYNGSTYTTFAAYKSGSSQDAHSTTIAPIFNSAVGNDGTCYTSGTPAGPQPCPTAYQLVNTSTLIGLGTAVSSPGAVDYYGNTIPNGIGSGYNIGAYGGVGVAPPVTGYNGPGNIASGAIAFWGLRAYTAAYASGAGKLINVTLSTNSHTCDILASSNGGLGNTASCSTGGDNGQSASSFCGSHCTIGKFYDQSGATNCTSAACDVAQATAANQPSLTFNCIGSLPCAVFNGTSDTMQTAAALNANNALPFSASMVLSVVSFSSFGGISVFTPGNYFGAAEAAGTLETFGNTGGATATQATGTMVSAQGVEQAGSGNGKIVVTGSAFSGTFTLPASSIGDRINLGSDGFTSFANVQVTELGWWSGAFSHTQYANLCHNAFLYWGLPGSC